MEAQLSEVIGRLVPNAPLLAVSAGAGLALFSGTAARIIERFDGSGPSRRSR
ncbi:MAG: hypothetical protein HKN80_15255 [Acidimicrobiia bacterium]|nr:hypothetical protein [Acidimicrobiia bacterium]